MDHRHRNHQAIADLRIADDGFQTAEALGIAAVGVLVAFAMLALLQQLGVDVVGWISSQFSTA